MSTLKLQDYIEMTIEIVVTAIVIASVTVLFL